MLPCNVTDTPDRKLFKRIQFIDCCWHSLLPIMFIGITVDKY